jgi:hypothetical protein
MPCYQSTSLPSGVTSAGRTSYATESDCLDACKEGACCEGTTCSVKPQCQCQGTGQTFKGVGTTCTPSPCNLCDLGSIAIVTQGTAAGFYASSFASFPCADASYSVSVDGSGSLAKNNGFLNSLVCSVSGSTPRCAYVGGYSTTSGASVEMIVVFFTVGADVRFSVRVQIRTTSDAARAACSGNSAVCAYESCSGTIGTYAGGVLSVDWRSVAPLAISGGGSYSFAARGGSISVSFNPLP